MHMEKALSPDSPESCWETTPFLYAAWDIGRLETVSAKPAKDIK